MRHEKYQDRDELARWMVDTWRDAIAFKYTQSIMLTKFDRLYNDKRWKRLPQYMKEYVRGYQESFRFNVIDRQFLEHGYWVIMPDGTEKWFGVAERVNDLAVYGISYAYLDAHQIKERSGIYWVADPKKGTKPGECPFFTGKDWDESPANKESPNYIPV